MKKGVVASSRDLSKKSFIKWSLGGSALLNPSLSNNFLQLFKSILSRNKEGKKVFSSNIFSSLQKKSMSDTKICNDTYVHKLNIQLVLDYWDD